MRNLLINIAYNGANYHGYQVQNNAITIMEVVQDAIEEVFKIRHDIVGCSRTDSKVHANSYYFGMKTEINVKPHKLVFALNNFLPADICVKSCVEVDENFHARYNVLAKEYLYKVHNSSFKNPFSHNLALEYKKPIDVDLLNRAAKHFEGEHDYTGFCSVGGKLAKPVKMIYYFDVYREGDFVYFKVCGNNFLYNMVRIMVGTLLRVNEGKIKEDEIPDIILSKDRKRAGKTAGPHGLYLNKIDYGSDAFGEKIRFR